MIKKILLIDDDQDEQVIFSEALKEIADSIKCAFALTAEEGLKIIKEFMPDLVFLDINMPAVNGFECLTLIKRDAQLNSTPLIIYSTSINETACGKAKKIGAADCLQKCASIHELSKALKDYINQ